MSASAAIETAEEEKEEETAMNPAAALAMRKVKRKVVTTDKTVPHITNLNEDP